MTKLIGTNPNQVSSNADLGTAAFKDTKDFLSARGSSLSTIDATIGSTALDVFVYNTNKDSDGGAWRKRTQHTSWYKENLNTETRGSRREFPSVAVIVMEYATLTEDPAMTIYDGDDPSLPMWMVCRVDSNNRWIRYNGTIRAVKALNGIIVAVANGNDVTDSLLSRMNLLEDNLERHFENAHQIDDRGIVHRNRYFDISYTKPNYLVSRYLQCVDMTVRPNAPIDGATGLPVPTIAVGAQNGLSILKDDGTVINRTTSFVNASTPGGVSKIMFDNNGGYWYTNSHYPIVHSADGHAAVLGHTSSIDTTGSISSSDGQVYSELMMAQGSNDVGNSTHWSTSTMPGVWMNHGKGGGNSTQANSGKMNITPHGDFSNKFGVHKFLPNYLDHSASSVAFITSDYNTGYMPGKTKLATLSNTNAGTNTYDFVEGFGDFLVGSAWTTDTGWSTSGNVATKTSGTGSNYISKSISRPFVADKWYRAEITLQSGSASNILLVNRHRSGVVKPYSGGATNVDVAFFQVLGSKCAAVWQQSNINNGLISLYSGSAVTVDDLKVYEIDAYDRSIVGNHPFDMGTLTKTPVASGAELMGYSGFSSTSGFAQPYTSALNPGTGDYCFMIWFKTEPTSTEQTIMRRFGNPTVTGGTLMRITGSTSLLSWYTRDTSSTVGVTNSPSAVDDGLWHMAVGVRDANRAKLYLDGEEVDDVSTSANSHDPGTTASLLIGVENTSTFGSFANPASDTTLALARYTLTAPTETQIRELYENEKYLFADNAKATLYGTSDVVTSLVYDDDTNLLHAGTSGGRSMFQGLQRIDNTTQSVETAISAVDGFVVEE